MMKWIIPVLVVSIFVLPRTGDATMFDNGNGTVTDGKTGLVWQQGETEAMNWETAISYCEGLSLGGHSDWRLPNIKELEFLCDEGRMYPTIDKNYFPDAIGTRYRSSTTNNGQRDSAWYVDFGSGFVGSVAKSDSMRTRCVRRGENGSLGDLNINYSGNGSGIISGSGVKNGVPADFSTNTATSELFDIGSTIALHAEKSEFSIFSGWSGACSGTAADCEVSMGAESDVTAIFDMNSAVKTRVGDTSNYYSTLQEAYDAAAEGETVKAWGTVFIENLTCGQEKEAAIQGGYHEDYSTGGNLTTLQGTLTVSNGALTVGNLAIR